MTDTTDTTPGRPCYITEVLDIATLEELHDALTRAYEADDVDTYAAVLAELWLRTSHRDLGP